MRKMILFLIALALMVSPVLAAGIYTPLPVIGTVQYSDGTPAKYIDVSITDKNTGELIKTTTDESGLYLVDWANSLSKYRSGDIFLISVAGSDKTAVYSGSIDLKVDFTLGESTPVTCPTAPTCAVCDACECVQQTCDICEPCQTDMNNLIMGGGILAILAFLATAFGAFKGRIKIVVYKKYINAKGKNAYHWVTLFQRAD